jgi:hypothetical protein
MQSQYPYDGRPQGRYQDRDPGASRTEPPTEQEVVAERFGSEIESRRSPRQRRLANAIYQQLEGGAEVEDIAHLIADMSRTAGTDNRIQGRPRR